MGIKCDDARLILDDDGTDLTRIIAFESRMELTASEFSSAKSFAATSQTAFDDYLGHQDRGGSWYSGQSTAAKEQMRAVFNAL